MKKVFICSPYSGDVEKNVANAKRYCRQAIDEGSLPLAPHLYFTQMLDDAEPIDRSMGCALGLAWLKDVDEVRVFGGKVTAGMLDEITWATRIGVPIVQYDADGRRTVEGEI